MTRKTKLSFAIMLLPIVFVLSIALLACNKNPGAGAGNTSTADPADFSDIPVYPSARRDETEQIDFGIEPIISPGSFSRTEWRYYTTTDSKDKLADFYRKELGSAQSVWKQAAWGDIGDKVSWGIFTKSGDPAVWVVLNVTDSGTKFALVKGTGKMQP
ncbi:MAG: hypothetical protein EXR50_04205 [Dehalococcoidia bacterium]|nr:hypothetical protein [Dehalococcoidia bacterium]